VRGGTYGIRKEGVRRATVTNGREGAVSKRGKAQHFKESNKKEGTLVKKRAGWVTDLWARTTRGRPIERT